MLADSWKSDEAGLPKLAMARMMNVQKPITEYNDIGAVFFWGSMTDLGIFF